jgi:hypothetical protein
VPANRSVLRSRVRNAVDVRTAVVPSGAPADCPDHLDRWGRGIDDVDDFDGGVGRHDPSPFEFDAPGSAQAGYEVVVKEQELQERQRAFVVAEPVFLVDDVVVPVEGDGDDESADGVSILINRQPAVECSRRWIQLRLQH